MRQKVEKELKERQKSAKKDKASLLEAVKNIDMTPDQTPEPEPEPEIGSVSEGEEEASATEDHRRPSLEKNASNRRFAAARQAKLSETLPAMNGGSNRKMDDEDDDSCSQVFLPIGKDIMKKLTTPSAKPVDASGFSKFAMSQSCSTLDSDDTDDAPSEASASRRASNTKRHSAQTKAKHSQSLSDFQYQHDIEVEERKANKIQSADVDDGDQVYASTKDEVKVEVRRETMPEIEGRNEDEVSTPSKKPKGILKRTSTTGPTTPMQQSNAISQSMHEANPTRSLLHSLYDGGKEVSARSTYVEPSTPKKSKQQETSVSTSPSSTPTKRRSRTGQLNRTPSSRRAMGDRTQSSRRLKRGEESSRKLSEKKSSMDSSNREEQQKHPSRTAKRSSTSKSDDVCSTPKGEEKQKVKSTSSPRSRLRTSSKNVDASPKPERGRSGHDTEEKKSRTRSRSRNRDPRAAKRASSRTRNQRCSTRPTQTETPSSSIRIMSDHSELTRGPRRSRQKGSLRKAVSDRHGMHQSSLLPKASDDDSLMDVADFGGESALQFDPTQRSNVSVLTSNLDTQETVKLLDGMLESEEGAKEGLLQSDNGKDVKGEKVKKTKSRGSIMKLPWIGKKSAGKANSNED
jgi:hypothetical protein